MSSCARVTCVRLAVTRLFNLGTLLFIRLNIHELIFTLNDISAEVQSFSGWRLAFEVDLKLIDATEQTISDVILKRLDRHHHSSFKQLIIDFSSESAKSMN